MPRRLFFLFCLSSMLSSCKDEGAPPQQTQNQFVSADSTLFRIITQTEPFSSYTIFPHADSVTSGTLNGSAAHQPQVRVSLNSRAAGALQSGRYAFPFPDGSIIFKEIRTGGATSLYAVIYKDTRNPLAGNGWLWAEYQPNGAVLFSITTRGVNCTGCHAREQGPQNDFVRTFERQR